MFYKCRPSYHIQEQNIEQMRYFRDENGVLKNFDKIGVPAKGVSTRVLTQKRLFDQSLKNKCYVNRYPNKSFKNKTVEKFAFFWV